MTILSRLKEKRTRERWERFDRENRWRALADYNAEHARGLLHSEEWHYRMLKEQEAFDLEHGVPSRYNGFGQGGWRDPYEGDA